MRMTQTRVSAMKERRLIAFANETSDYNYDISRAFLGSTKEAWQSKSVTGAIGALGDMAYSGFKLGSDALKAVRGEKEKLQKLGGIQRIKESTIGAVTNVVGGIGGVFKNPVKGAARVGQGVLDAFDIIPATAADTWRGIWGPRTGAIRSETRAQVAAAMG